MDQEHTGDRAPAWRRPRPAPGTRAAGRDRTVGALLLVLALAGCSASGPDGVPTPDPDPPAADSPTADSPAGDPSAAESSGAPGVSPGADPSAAPEPSAAADPSAAPTSAPPTASEGDDPSSVGALPAGFPVDLLPVPAGAEILVAHYVPVGATGPGAPYDVSLNLRTTASVADVVAFYRASLTTAGFTESVGAPAAGTLAAESTYSRGAGAELVVVGVLDRDAVRTVTIGGRVHGSA